MVYKRPYRKNSVRKTSRKPGTFRKKVAQIAKTVALRQQETKHHVTDYGTFNLYHDLSTRITDQLLKTNQGVADSVIGSRIGDTITLRGLKMYFKFEAPFDRPNTTTKIWILKARKGSLPTSVPVKAITSNVIMDPVDMEKINKVLAVRTYKFNQNVYKDTTTYAVPNVNFRTLWIPLNNHKYHYFTDNNVDGRDWNLAMYAATYDHSGALITDNIMDIHVAGELFFKDG